MLLLLIYSRFIALNIAWFIYFLLYKCIYLFRVSPYTVLMYCTNGVLLRTLMAGESVLATLTHIIIDEIHERDRLNDFVLIVLREALAKFRSLHLILMSATADISALCTYFSNCTVISGIFLF